MKRAKVATFSAIIALAVLAVWAQVGYGFPQYTQQTGQTCTYCHIEPTGEGLTAAGQYFRENRTLEGFTPPEEAPAAPPAEAPPLPPAELPPAEEPGVAPVEPPPAPPAEVPEIPPAPELAPPPPTVVPPLEAPAVPEVVDRAEPIPEARARRLPVTGGSIASMSVLGIALLATGAWLYRKRR